MAKATIPAILSDDASPIDAFRFGTPGDFDTSVLYHNMMPIRGKDKEWLIMKRPTFLSENLDSSSGTDYGRGCFYWDDTVFSVISNKIYEVGSTGGASTLQTTMGTDYDTSFQISHTLYGQAGADWGIIHSAGSSGGTKGMTYYASTTGSGWTEITDVDMPGQDGNIAVRGVVALDGYLFLLNSTGQIHNSDLDDCTSWSALSFLTAERVPDAGVYLGKHKDHVVYFGSASIEFFYNSGSSSGSPLARRQDLYYNVGCIMPNSIVEMGDIIYFIGYDQTGDNSFYKLENFQLTKVASPHFQYICSLLGSKTSALGRTPISKYPITMINVPGSGLTYVASFYIGNVLGTYACHIETGIVSKWYVGSEPTYDGHITSTTWAGNYLPLSGSTLANVYDDNNGSENVVQFTNGDMATLPKPGVGSLNDIGLTAPSCHYYTPVVDVETSDRKRWNSVALLQYPGMYSGFNDGSSAVIELDWYDYDTWATNGIASAIADDTFFVGKGHSKDAAGPHCVWRRCGASRMRIFKVIFPVTAAIPTRGLEIDYDILRG